jgi:nicotinamide-nucleotide amidase
VSHDVSLPCKGPYSAVDVVDALQNSGRTLAVAESFTGGLLALRITETPDSGSVFRGGVVSYLPEVKRELLSVPDVPVVSAVCAEAMAAGVAALFGADVGVSTTGVAGPATEEGQPVGTVYIGYSTKGEGGARRLALSPAGSPEYIREASVEAALVLLHHRLHERP